MAFRESFNPWVELRKSLIAWAFASSPVCSLFSQMPLGNCHCSYSKLLADPGASHTFFMLLWLEICWCFGLKCAFPLCICLIYSLSLSFQFLPTHHRNHSESLACPPLLSVPTTLGTSINEHIPRYSLTASLLCATEISQVRSLVCEHEEPLALPGIGQTTNVGDRTTEWMH